MGVGDGGRGARAAEGGTFPLKVRKKKFFGQFLCKIQTFFGQESSKIRAFLLIFHTYFSGENVTPPLKLTELIRPWGDV